MQKIKCNSINYRKGFIEVLANIHSGCINIETWSIHPDADISEQGLVFNEIPYEYFTGNTEIELNLKNAEELLTSLQKAILELKTGKEETTSE